MKTLVFHCKTAKVLILIKLHMMFRKISRGYYMLDCVQLFHNHRSPTGGSSQSQTPCYIYLLQHDIWLQEIGKTGSWDPQFAHSGRLEQNNAAEWQTN